MPLAPQPQPSLAEAEQCRAAALQPDPDWEEALAAEVKELNRTVGRLRREASEARRRRLCDVSYETRLKQQKENRASSPPTVHLSLRDVDEDWHQQTNDPGRSDGAYERAMSHYVARLNDAERNELEYYRSLSSFSF